MGGKALLDGNLAPELWFNCQYGRVVYGQSVGRKGTEGTLTGGASGMLLGLPAFADEGILLGAGQAALSLGSQLSGKARGRAEDLSLREHFAVVLSVVVDVRCRCQLEM